MTKRHCKRAGVELGLFIKQAIMSFSLKRKGLPKAYNTKRSSTADRKYDQLQPIYTKSACVFNRRQAIKNSLKKQTNLMQQLCPD